MRSSLKWTGITLCAATLILWGASSFTGLSYSRSTPTGTWSFWLCDGVVTTARYEHSLPRLQGWRRFPPNEPRTYGLISPRWVGSKRSGSRMLHAPLWLPLAAFAIPTIALILHGRLRRIPPGHCRKCAYDLTGNTSGVCPECGTPYGSPA
jgi:hypothetical protein